MEKKFSAAIVSAIRDCLERNELKFNFYESEGRFQFIVRLGEKVGMIVCYIRVFDHSYVVYGVLPFKVLTEKLQPMAEFLTRANQGLRHGNFEMDFTDGEIRYKSFVDCEDMTELPFAIVEKSVYCPLAMFSKYGDGIIDVLLGNSTPEEACAKCEKRLSE